MSPASLEAQVSALHALVASGAAPAAQPCTDVLADLQPLISAADAGELKAAQRDAEEALLKVLLTPPGVGPPQRALAGACLAALFTHGSGIAVFARVSELTALLTAKGVSKTAQGVRVGALEALVALSHALQSQLAGSFARFVTDVCAKHATAAEADVRSAALALLAAALEHAPALPLLAQEAALKTVRVACMDKVPAVRSQAVAALAAMASGGDGGAALWVGDKGSRGEVFTEAVAVAQALLKDPERIVRDAASAALGALAAAAVLPPAAAALAAAKPDARARLAKVLEDPVGDALGSAFVKAKSRPVRTAVADAWVAFLAAVAGLLDNAVVVTHAVAAVAALRALASTPGRVNAGDEDVHAAACALYVIRAGAARHLTEAGQRLLLAALLAQLGEQPDSTPPLLLIAALRGCADTLSRLGEVTSDIAAASEAPLRRALAQAPTHTARAEAAMALRALALASPPAAAQLLRAGLEGLRAADPRATDALAVAQLHGHASLVAAIIAGAPSLLLGLPLELPAAALDIGVALLGGRSAAAKTSGWLLLAAVLAGPSGPKAAAVHGPMLLQLWNIAFAREDVLAPRRKGAFELRQKGADAVTELSWRAAAAEALEAFLRTAVGVGLRAGASSAASLAPTLRGALALAGDAALSEAGVPGSPERAAAALLRLRLLEALQALPSASMYAPLHPQVLALATGCLEPGAPPTRRLLLALLEPADASLGPVAPGRDALEDALRVFEGGADAPTPKLWLPLARGASHTLGPFPSPLPCAAALAEAQALECGRLWAAGGADMRVNLAASFAVAARGGYGASRDALSRATAASNFGRTPSSALLAEGAVGGSPALTNAAAAGLAALRALSAAAGATPGSADEAAALDDLGRALLGDPAPGAAHLRAAAELRGAATRMSGDAGALRAVGELTRALRAEKSGAARGAAALAVGAAFRTAGGMALAPAVAAAVDALAAAAAEPDASPACAHLWAAHGLWLVANAAGAAFARHAALTLDLAHGLLSSDAAMSVAPHLVQTAGRLVNAAVGALGPELDPGGRTFRRCAALIAHVRTAGRDDPGAQLQDVLFLQSCVLFAPQALPPSAMAPQLRTALRARQPPLRAAAATVAHNVAETNPAGLLPENLEAPLFGLLDFEYDADTVADARGALEALLRADAPEVPMRWLRLTGAIACADAARLTRSVSTATDLGQAGGDGAPGGDGGGGGGGGNGADVRAAGAAAPNTVTLPSWRTRAFAAELMARVPDAVGDARQHFDLAEARALAAAAAPPDAPPPGWLVLHLQAAVDLGYRVATAPTAALRPWGLVLLRRLLARWGAVPDPDVPDAALMEQYSAQVLSSLRAALAPGCAPNACAAGAALAAEFVACGLSARDPAVHKRVLALLGAATAAWGPPPATDADADGEPAPEYSQWSGMCTKAALLIAHARMASAAPDNVPLRSAQAKMAPALAAGWLALLRDFAAAVGLHESARSRYAPAQGDETSGAADATTVLALANVPIARHAIARAHLAYAWRPVLAAVSSFAVPAGVPRPGGAAASAHAVAVPLTPDDHGLALSLACWALTREAASYVEAASKIDSGGPAGVWGAGPGFLPNDPAAASGAAALSALLSPQFLAAPEYVPLQALAEVMTTVAAAAAARGAHPLLATAAPALLQRVGEALPPGALACADGEDEESHGGAVVELFAAALGIARAALDRVQASGAALPAVTAAAQGLAGLAALVARVPRAGASPACASLLPTAMGLALAVLPSPAAAAHDAVGAGAAALLAAAAGACAVPAAVDAAAESLAHTCADLAEDASAAPRLGVMLSALSALGAAAETRSAARRRCLDALSVLLDEEAGCPPAVQREALAALLRAITAAAAEAPGSAKRRWAEAALGAVGPAAGAAASRSLTTGNGTVPSGDACAVASEAIKALAAAIALAPTDEAKTGVLLVLLPLLIAAAAPEAGTLPAPALQALAVSLVTRTAAAAPDAFKQAVSALAPDTKARLQVALRAGAPAAVTPAASGGARIAAAGRPGAIAAPPAISLKGFKAPPPR
jgi:hypothetical protein